MKIYESERVPLAEDNSCNDYYRKRIVQIVGTIDDEKELKHILRYIVRNE